MGGLLRFGDEVLTSIVVEASVFELYNHRGVEKVPEKSNQSFRIMKAKRTKGASEDRKLRVASWHHMSVFGAAEI